MMFIAWMYDIARDQSPSEELLDLLCERSIKAGYNAICLYFEHRFAYPSAPWAASEGCVTPEMIRRVAQRHKPLRIVPMLNVLGHMEGFIRAEGGRHLSEQQCGHQEQICPSRSECVSFARDLVQDALDIFEDEWIHIGGDETWQLGSCPLCKEREAKIGKAGIYAEHFVPLCQMIVDAGRRPGLWGDMLIQHPDAMDSLPRETVIFDWHYESAPEPSAPMFMKRGFDVVCSPTIKLFDANWTALDRTFENVDQHVEVAQRIGAMGVCATTWEANYFAIFGSYIPVIMAAGRRMSQGVGWEEALLTESDPNSLRAMIILGREIPAAAPFLAQGRGATLRAYLAMRLNPFYLWTKWREEAVSAVGDKVLELCDEATSLLQREDPLCGMVELHLVGVRWVRFVEQAYQAYRLREFVGCQDALRRGQSELSRLRPYLERSARNGGAYADLYRLERLEKVVDEVIEKIASIAQVHTGGYIPAFDIVIDGGYVVGDTAAWRTGSWR